MAYLRLLFIAYRVGPSANLAKPLNALWVFVARVVVCDRFQDLALWAGFWLGTHDGQTVTAVVATSDFDFGKLFVWLWLVTAFAEFDSLILVFHTPLYSNALRKLTWRYYINGMPTVTLHNCDNAEIPIEKHYAIVSDPPYGSKTDTNYTRFTGGLSPERNHWKNCEGTEWKGIANDDKPFDPTPWIKNKKVILFGYQFFAQHLPLGTVLVWCKKRPTAIGKFLSDCELAWQKGGYGCYQFNHIWSGFDRQTELGKTLHPTQKPVALMRWCIERLKLPEGSTIYDPFMGAGATGVAAVELGHNFVGCEIEPAYFSIAQQRIQEALDNKKENDG